MKTVLAPIDFSPVSERVIAQGISFARANDARLVLLHVVAPLALVGRNFGLTANGAESTAAADKHAAERLTSLQRSLRDEGVTAHAIHVIGDPPGSILEQAERLEANYIVMGSHGHSAVYDLLAGSTANGVLQGAACPVVIVPPAAGALSVAKAARTEPLAAVGAGR